MKRSLILGLVVIMGLVISTSSSLRSRSELISKCADPFSLQSLMDMKMGIQSIENDGKFEVVTFRTQEGEKAEEFTCKYQLYCAAEMVAPFESYLGAKGGLEDELEAIEKEKTELKQAQEEMETNAREKREAKEKLEKELKEQEEAQKNFDREQSETG